ncbi:bifunctional UDP-sugar hydrolase/5'-nucleotidase [Treponema sp. C6A8]|uniref:bifunctional metallophosphatase/5'-nucleotidase n=1 Tax=Treponema sp. C6A8 TaxID=1410609 RepID=UPI000488F9D4|nr:bifunctional UDP-sugar hydrolase/5'-nucleotidase [Treponema sp. C6A8]
MKKSKFMTALLAAAFFTISAFAANPDKDIVILYTNDVHCGVDDSIGYAGLSLYKQEMKELTPYVTLVDAGDALQGATIGSFSKGEYIVNLMNETGYDLAIPGNHEFDYGIPQLMKMSKKLKCGYISCNFLNKKGKAIFPAYKIFSYGDTKVAFVGVSTPETLVASNPVTFQDKKGNTIYDFGGDKGGMKMVELTQAAIDEARSKGADFVILLAHLGEKTTVSDWNSMNLIARISGADALIDSHSHEITPLLMAEDKDGKAIPITQSGTKLLNIGKVTISTEGKITTELVSQVPAKDSESKDARIAAEIETIKADIHRSLNKTIGYIDYELPALDANKKWLTRSGELPLGDFITDAGKAIFKADVAIINGGGIRGGIDKGDITLYDMLSVHPFGNYICLYEISGQSLLDELEYGAKKVPENFGGFLHVSGISYKINTAIPSSVEVNEKACFTGNVNGEYRVHDVYVNGQPLDVNKTYRIAGPDFVIANHGDGHLFKGAKLINSVTPMVDCDVLTEYVKSLGGSFPEKYKEAQNRIVIEK